MTEFETIYKSLNPRQAEAVDTIEGPLLVLAGPGTGKTQLLSARVARILQATDTLPENILCLTFTENGAANMRERLSQFIGQAANRVQINTYHAFGDDIIRRYPEYFTYIREQQAVDPLVQHDIIKRIVAKMSYQNPLKQTQYHIKDLISTISEVKRALLSPADLRQISQDNLGFIEQASKLSSRHLAKIIRMPSRASEAIELFTPLLSDLTELAQSFTNYGRFSSLAQTAASSLASALEEVQSTQKSSPATQWKTNWLVKNSEDEFVFDGVRASHRIDSLANVIESYSAELDKRGLYDFDDMILRAVTALESNDDLRFTLQERHQYIMLDEFQDTNPAQFQIVRLLSDNPVHEGRPNVMAVGDDDQAIFAFQGAQFSNMRDFYQSYRDVKIINLDQNYRSHADILHTAEQIAGQIDSRLHHEIPNISKDLTAASQSLPKKSLIERVEFMSDVAEHHWIAQRTKQLIKSGVAPNEIAILAPKHRHLEAITAHLHAQSIPIHYEKSENILQSPIILELLSLARLTKAVAENDHTKANVLWPRVLSFDFFKIPISTIWQISWQANTDKSQSAAWTQQLLSNPLTRPVALLVLSLAARAETEPLESLFDQLIGTDSLPTNEPDIPTVRSALRSHYINSTNASDSPNDFYRAITHLRVLRSRLMDYRASAQLDNLTLAGLLEFVDLHEAADQQMLDTSPYHEGDSAVQLMTVFKAKGLEFEHVFLVSCQDEVWGKTSRSDSNRLSLPHNLSPIRHAGATDDERLRLLFVAITRARHGLHLSSHTTKYSGKATRRLEYFDEQKQSDGSFKSLILPATAQNVIPKDGAAPELKQLEIDWRHKHIASQIEPDLKQILHQQLQNYRLSPTHLTTYTDMEYGGPKVFFLTSLLKFPQATSLDMHYGNAIHETLEWLQRQLDATGQLPDSAQAGNHLSDRLKGKHLAANDTELLIEKGRHSLEKFLASRSSMFSPNNPSELNMAHANIQLGPIRLGGKIDYLDIDKQDRTIRVIDFKTGTCYPRWQKNLKLHRYKTQLYCYKLLVENSPEFANYAVNRGTIMFVDPSDSGEIHQLDLEFNDQDTQRTKQLLKAMWHKVMNLDFPDTSQYSNNLAGTLAFENDLLNELDKLNDN